MESSEQSGKGGEKAGVSHSSRARKIARRGVRSATQAGRFVEATIQDLLEGDMDVTIAGKSFQGVNTLVRVACHGDAVDELGKRMTRDEEEEKKDNIKRLEEELRRLKDKKE